MADYEEGTSNQVGSDRDRAMDLRTRRSLKDANGSHSAHHSTEYFPHLWEVREVAILPIMREVREVTSHHGKYGTWCVRAEVGGTQWAIPPTCTHASTPPDYGCGATQ